MPTPVSALIHAATMVTAGVYLLMRTSPLIEYSSTVLILCLWIGAITTVFSSLIGLFQQDIKKVIAYSTMSRQLAREYIQLDIFRHQTICVEIIETIINSQITKAQEYIYTHVNNSSFNSFTAQRLYFCILGYTVMSVKWGIIILSKLVGISEAIRLILVQFKLTNISLKFKILLFIFTFIFIIIIILDMCAQQAATPGLLCNLQGGFLGLGTHVEEKPVQWRQSLKYIVNNYSTVNLLKTCNIDEDICIAEKFALKESQKFDEWLAGLIDGDGYFILTKKGYASCEITIDIRDKQALYLVKQKFGGTIKPISNANALRYKLRHKKGLINLINAMNGLIRNPIRMLQMNKLCVKYGIELKYPLLLTYNNGWLSGFIDSDGSVYYSEKSGQVFIGISQKNRFLLEPLISLYGGRIDIFSPKIDAFKYIVYRKTELLSLINNYFSKYPLKTKKASRINLIKQFYPLLTYSKSTSDIGKFNEWIAFKDKWEKYRD